MDDRWPWAAQEAAQGPAEELRLMYTEKVTERSAVVAWLAPASRGAGDNNSDIVDMSLVRRLVADVLVGAITGLGTVTATLYANTAASVSSPAPVAITGKTLAGSDFSTSDDSNGIARLEVTSEEVAALGAGYRYVFLRLTGATAAAFTAAILTAHDNRYGEIADLAAVREIVA